VREWWTLGPEPGPNTLEARAVEPATGEKLVFATFHATPAKPPPADQLARTWIGTREDGVTVSSTFTNMRTTGTNSRTGNSAAVYQGVLSAPGLNTQTFGAYFEPPVVYWGAVSQGELTGPDTLDVWSDYVPGFRPSAPVADERAGVPTCRRLSGDDGCLTTVRPAMWCVWPNHRTPAGIIAGHLRDRPLLDEHPMVGRGQRRGVRTIKTVGRHHGNLQ
jgi:hypothetical protein